MIDPVHPWNQMIWKTLTQSLRQTNHAWLFRGSDGVGKTATAINFALHVLLLDANDPVRTKTLFCAGSHPDIHVLMPEQTCVDVEGLVERYALRYVEGTSGKAKSVISVDQVRRLIDRVSMRSHGGGNKYVLITPAERMNLNAANALLKVLEEPPGETVFCLITTAPHRLPATIISRCSPVNFREPDKTVARAWLLSQDTPESNIDALLAAAGGAPIRARRLQQTGFLERRSEWLIDVLDLVEGHGDPVGLATRWGRNEVASAIDWIHRFMVDLVRVTLVGQPKQLYNPDARGRLQEIAKRINLNVLFNVSERIGTAKQLLDSPVDPGLLLEDLFIHVGDLRSN